VHEWTELAAPARQPAPGREDRPDVTASDVGDYTFCGLSWWRDRQRAGVGAHARAGMASSGDLVMRLVWICVAYAAVIAGICGCIVVLASHR